jgi:hypothetical protein
MANDRAGQRDPALTFQGAGTILAILAVSAGVLLGNGFLQCLVSEELFFFESPPAFHFRLATVMTDRIARCSFNHVDYALTPLIIWPREAH